MADWKKVIVSGSTAVLGGLTLPSLGTANSLLAIDANGVISSVLSSGVTGNTNLSDTPGSNSYTIHSSTGNDVALNLATTTNWGLMSDEQFDKLAGIESGADVNVNTNLSDTATGTAYTIHSSTGTDVSLNLATTSAWGLMSDEQFDKLAGIESGADVNVNTNLSDTATGASYTIHSSTGTDVALNLATTSAWGLMSDEQFDKLAGIESGADVNVNTNLTDTATGTAYTIHSSTGTDVALNLATTSAWGLMSDEQFDKLAGIEAGATSAGTTNLTDTPGSNSYTIHSSTGTDVALNLATTTNWGLMSDEQFDKLAGIEALADVTDTANVKSALGGQLGGWTVGDEFDVTTFAGGINVQKDVNVAQGTISASAVQTGDLTVSGSATMVGNLVFNGITFSETAIGTHTGSHIWGSGDDTNTHEFTGSVYVKNDIHLTDDLFVGDNATIADVLTVNESIDLNGSIDVSGISYLHGNVSTDGTIDGRNVATDGSKLDGIAAGAQVNVNTNLTDTPGSNSYTIHSSTGTDVALNLATTTNWGLMSDEQFDKLAGIEAGATSAGTTNLTDTPGSNSYTIHSSTGTDVALNLATTTNWGLMSDEQFDKLAGIESGADVNVNTNLTDTATGTAYTIHSSTGTDVSLNLATTSAWGLMSDEQFDKLAGIEAGATSTGVTNLSDTATGTAYTIHSSTGTDVALNLATTSAWGLMSDEQFDKLAGIEAGATSTGTTNLSDTATGNAYTIHSSTGNDVALNLATTSAWGLMSDEQFDKLAGIEAGADNVDTANVKAALGGNLGSMAFGDSTDHITFGNDVTVTGDFIVNGSTVTLSVTNMAVEDQFIQLGDGNNTTGADFGIVFGDNAGSGDALFWDGGYGGGGLGGSSNDGRLGIANGLSSTALAATANYHLAGVFQGTSGNAATAQADHTGNIRIESGDVYIYA
jgi:hypothetical protein